MRFFNLTFNLLSSAVSAASDGASPKLTFEPQRFLEMLGYMGKGMLVIFILIGIIVIVTMLINKLFSKE